MDILEIQTRLTDFMMSQVTAGPGHTAEAEALRKDLDALIATHGGEMPELQHLADQLDLLKDVARDPDLSNRMAEEAMRDFVPDPELFEAIDDGDIEAVKAALKDWDINATHGEFEKTALYAAMSNMFGVSLPIVTLLLDEGADPKLGLGETSNVLHGLGFGVCDGIAPAELAQVIKRCVALGADIEQRSNKLGWTPLITAASEWNPVAVEALLLAGANIAAKAGEVAEVCFSGASAEAFADGHEATKAIFDRYQSVV